VNRVALATAALVAAAASLALLVAAHIARPEIPVLTSVVSQYAVGPFGWIQALVFATLAVSCLALFVVLLRTQLSAGGRIGTWLLLAASIGLALAAVFELGQPMHEVASMIGNLSLPVAMLLIGIALKPRSRGQFVVSHLPWIGVVLMMSSLFLLPDVVGLANRFVVLAYVAWLLLVSSRLRSAVLTAPVSRSTEYASR
jgi:hypothetical membrane protein